MTFLLELDVSTLEPGCRQNEGVCATIDLYKAWH